MIDLLLAPCLNFLGLQLWGLRSCFKILDHWNSPEIHRHIFFARLLKFFIKLLLLVNQSNFIGLLQIQIFFEVRVPGLVGIQILDQSLLVLCQVFQFPVTNVAQ
jgi:hypothetical protein